MYQGGEGFIDVSVCRDSSFDEKIQSRRAPPGTLIHAECCVSASAQGPDFNLFK